MILQTWNLTKFHSDSHERLNRGSEGFKARRSGYLSLDWERGIEVNKWSYLITRSWMSTARASSMWWPWRGLLKSSPNRLFFRWAAPRICGFGIIKIPYIRSMWNPTSWHSKRQTTSAAIARRIKTKERTRTPCHLPWPTCPSNLGFLYQEVGYQRLMSKQMNIIWPSFR